MTEVEKLAHFVTDARFEWLSERAREDLKARVLDSIGCAIGALRAGPIAAVRSLLPAADGSCTLIGVGHGSPEHATLYNGALVRYLDFMDIYMAKRHSGHPSDNFAPVLAAAELMGRSGRELLTALAVAYQVQARLLDEAPVESEGFDHTVQLAYSVAAGV
ncbi:MAG TPA: MmgE/PrpD family protein, partial [Polyangiaceae bacterium]|nr:MmgE/PrpD family protein [Polyangiaceae bacterium]